MRPTPLIAAIVISAGAMLAAQTAPIVQPGAPGQPMRPLTADRARDLSGVLHTAADVRFMQGMIAHHAQALDMTALVASRAEKEAIRVLAARIEVSQKDEIKMMREWLEARGEAAPAEHAHHAAGSPPMPGMLSAGEMARLGQASGAAFDRLFLELMIKHHEGALMMVGALFDSPGAGQESDIYAFASDVLADQQIEIRRMKGMLDGR
jgi:uncharacterized protein (DUF305 family)